MVVYRLEEDLSLTVQKLDVSLKRYYVVYSVQSGHVERALDFFKVCAAELANDKHWKAWFVLPYLKAPEADPNFAIFFSKGWTETFTLSLHNFLSTIFQSVPLPKILNFNIERKLRISLQHLNDSLMRENENLRSRNDKLRYEVEKLNKALATANARIGTLEQQIDLSTPTAAQLALLQHQQMQMQKAALSQQSVAGASAAMGASTPKRNDGTPDTSFGAGQTPIAYGSSNGNTYSSNQGSSNPATPTGAATTTFRRAQIPSTSPLPLATSGGGSAYQALTSPNSSNTQSSTTAFGGPGATNSAEGDDSHPALLQTVKVESFSTNSPLNCCKYSPDGNFIACGTQTGVTRIWPVGSQNSHRSATIYGNAEILALAWDQDSKILLVGSADGKVKVWNVAQEKSVGDIALAPFTKVKDIVCSPSGSLFACASSGSQKDPKSSAIHLLNAKTLQLVAKIDFPTSLVNSLAFNHNESMIVAGASDGHITIIGMDNKEPMSSWKAHVGPVLNVSYAPDYVSIYSIGADSKLQRWDAHNSGKRLRQYAYAGTVEGAKRVDLSFSEEGGYFVVPSKSDNAPIYARDTTTPILTIGNHKAGVTCCDWHPHSCQVMTGCMNGVICLTSLAPEAKTSSSH